MLTADLIRAQVRKGEIRPQWIDPDNPRLREHAALLCALWAGSPGIRRDELEDELAALSGDELPALLLRGLAKLLDDRSQWGTAVDVEPVELRRRLFERAFAAHPIHSGTLPGDPDTRCVVIEAVARELGVTAAQVEASMYGDLHDEQRLEKHDAIAPDELLHRYNLGLAQAILLRARELRIDVFVERPARLRWLFRQLKFHQLMHRTRRLDDGSWRITIDGPASILGGGQRYGVQMAQFLPSVVHLESWRVEADIAWPRHGEVVFRLTPKQSLRARVRETGTWISAEEQLLVERINASSSPWRAESCAEVLELQGQDVLVPDLVLRCQKTGRVAYVEIVGFWRKAWLEQRAERIALYAPSNLILCVSRRMKLDRDSVEMSGWVPFAEVIPVAKVLARAEELGA